MSEAYFETNGLTVGYGGRPLIRDISLSLKRGGIMTLIGPNGAGKSTILKTVTRRIPAISGDVLLGGQSLLRMRGRDLARKMAVVLTDRLRPELMTCFDVAAAGRYPYTGSFGLLSARDKSIVLDSLAQVNASNLAGADFNSVSDGERQLVLLARAIAQEPEIIVLDEPTSYLDIRHKIELLEVLRGMAKARGVTVLMSLHELDMASKVSDVMVCVGDGAVAASGPPEDVFSDELVRRLYHLERGSYSVALGSAELPRPEGQPRVFVLGGGGRGIPLYRGLQRAGVPFSAGILPENDLDLAVAGPLAAEVVTSPPFAPAGPREMEAARALISSSKAVIDAGAPAEHYPARDELLKYARTLGIPIIESLEHITEVLR